MYVISGKDRPQNVDFSLWMVSEMLGSGGNFNEMSRVAGAGQTAWKLPPSKRFAKAGSWSWSMRVVVVIRSAYARIVSEPVNNRGAADCDRHVPARTVHLGLRDPGRRGPCSRNSA
jgi:hypothetical protein